MNEQQLNNNSTEMDFFPIIIGKMGWKSCHWPGGDPGYARSKQL